MDNFKVSTESKQVTDQSKLIDMGDHGGTQTSEVDKSATTTFVDDSISVVTKLPVMRSGVTGLSVPAVSDPNLALFLAKPIIVNQTAWTTASASGTTLLTYTPTGTLSNDIFLSKVKGYKMFRGTLCIKVVINAQPFQAGRLLCRLLPFADNQHLSYGYSHNINFTTRTQQPNFELDCRDSSGTMEIPWVGPAPWLDLVNTTNTWGYFYIDVLSPLITGTSGSTTVEVSTMVYFKDVEFAGPLCPQGNETSRRSRYYPQAADGPKLRRRVKISNEQATIEAGKPISTMLSLSSRIAEIAKGVPLLSSIASPAAWVLRSASSLAANFGYSKPNLAAQPMYTVLRPLHNFGNSEGTSQAEPLAISSDPALTVLPGFGGTDVDEMSFNYIKSVPAYWGSFTFDSASAVGTNIFSTFVGPFDLGNDNINALPSPNQVGYTSYPPFAYVSRAFRYWKGSIHMVLKFVKTDFHSGRLMVVWTPTDNNTSTLATVDTSSYSMRTIIDLRETTEIDIELPYMIPRCWQAFSLGSGKVQLMVLNTLQFPDTVASTIKVLAYFYAGEDYAVAYPSNSYPLIPYTPQGGDKDNTKVLGVIGNQATHVEMMEEHTIGETFTSLKQLILRYSRLYFNASVTPNINGCVAMRIYPYAVGFYTGAVGAAMEYFQYGGDMYSYIAAGYALSRGGMKFNVNFSGSTGVYCDYSYEDYTAMLTTGWVQTSSTTVPNTTALSSGKTSNFFIPNTGTDSSASTANPAVFVQSTNGVEVLIPPYQMNPSRFIPYTANVLGTPNSPYSEQTIGAGALSIDTTSTATYKKVYRAAADDHQLGYFIGFPPVFSYTA